LLAFSLALAGTMWSGEAPARHDPVVHCRTTEVDDLKVFYREAGPPEASAEVLLHGFPTSSHMYRDLIPKLARSDPRAPSA
jgi:hypothetical protein